MRIAFFVHGYVPWDNYGVPKYIENLSSYLTTRNHNVAVFCVGRPELLRTEKIPRSARVYRSWYIKPHRFLMRLEGVWSLALYTLWCLTVAPSIVKRDKIDLIHGHTFEFGGIQSMFVSFITRRKCVITYHGVKLGRNKLEESLQKLLLPHARHLLCLNKAVADTFRDWGIQEDRFTLLKQYNIDLDRFRPDPNRRIKKPLTTIFVGRLNKFKGPDLFVDAASMVLSKITDMDFIVLGDGEMKPILETKISRKRLTNKVRLMGSVKDVKSWFSKSDIYVACSPHENLPSLSLLEAMASELAVVATNVGETSSLVKDQKTGLIANADAADIAEKIILLARNRKLRETLGTNARSELLKNDLVALGKIHEKIYSSVISGN